MNRWLGKDVLGCNGTHFLGSEWHVCLLQDAALWRRDDEPALTPASGLRGQSSVIHCGAGGFLPEHPLLQASSAEMYQNSARKSTESSICDAPPIYVRARHCLFFAQEQGLHAVAV